MRMPRWRDGYHRLISHLLRFYLDRSNLPADAVPLYKVSTVLFMSAHFLSKRADVLEMYKYIHVLFRSLNFALQFIPLP